MNSYIPLNYEQLNLLEGMYDVQHTVAGAGTQIENFATGVVCNIFDSHHMALGKVYHMDIVPYTGTIVGVVVVAVDTQILPSANGNLGDVGHQVIGNTPRIFADFTAFVGANGVKVPQ